MQVVIKSSPVAGKAKQHVNMSPCACCAFRELLSDASFQHLGLLVRQLLRSEGVVGEEEWVPILSRLAVEAVAELSPAAMAEHGNPVGRLTDPRVYVKVSHPQQPRVCV